MISSLVLGIRSSPERHQGEAGQERGEERGELAWPASMELALMPAWTKAPSRNLLLQVTGFWLCSPLWRKPVVNTLTVVTDLRGSLPLFVSKSHNIAMVDEDSCSAHSIDEETYCAAQVSSCARSRCNTHFQEPISSGIQSRRARVRGKTQNKNSDIS